MTFTLTLENYEALIALARAGTLKADGTVDLERSSMLDAYLRGIEQANGIERDGVWVQWQEMDAELPPGTNFPDVWPPSLRYYIELLTRRVSRSDVDAMLAARARKPVNVLATYDVAARVGWTAIDSFFTP